MQKLANKSIWVVEKDNPVKKTKRSTKSSKQSAILEQLEVDLGLATKKPRAKSTKKSELPVVKIHFLGGVEEIGKNCTAIECMDDIIVIDVGMSFPDGEMPGIDAVVPDTTFLEDNKDRLRAVILTHGHEDHVGGLPHLLAKVKVPVFGCKLALMILENKLVERKIDADLHTIRAGNEITLGCFKVEFIHVNHSIEGSTALCITTPLGKIFHTGDFKIDYTPVDNHITDLKRISQIGNEGVLCLLAESTNVEKAGYSISEKSVGKSLDAYFNENAEKRIIISTFATNVHRVQQIIDLAEKYNRKVALSGRSMIRIAEAAREIGSLHVNEGTLVDIEKISKIADKDLVVVATGTQGEPMSALSRMAADNFNKVKIDDNDCVIISASPIPGNEKMVYKVINNLYKLGADVIYSKLHEVHASGHACQEELKIMHSLLMPKYFIPVHGEYRHLKMHKDLAVSLGLPQRNCIIPEIGDTVELSSKGMKISGKVPAGAIMVDGFGFTQVDAAVMRDRRYLSQEGVMVAIITVNSLSGELVGDIELISKGVSLSQQPEKLILECKQVIIELLDNFDLKTFTGRLDAKDAVRSRLKNYIDKKVKSRPMVIPVIVEV